nr:MAG TPA: hypothetical protein [Caudoviricetes sp.]
MKSKYCYALYKRYEFSFHQMLAMSTQKTNIINL